MSLQLKSSNSQLNQRHVVEDRIHYEWGELEQRCTQALLAILPQMRQIINRDPEGVVALLTVQQYSVLKALKDQKRLISELADLLKVSRPTMSRIIDGLEGRRRSGAEESRRPKLVERVACQDDHRLVYARITEEGIDFLSHYCMQAEENITGVLRRMPASDLPQLLHSLEALTLAIQTRV